jgi:hypothetical protein
VHDLRYLLLDGLKGYRSFLESAAETAPQFFLIKRLTTPVLFDDARHHQLGEFISGEALLAAKALATTTHLPAVSDETRVNHFGLIL